MFCAGSAIRRRHCGVAAMSKPVADADARRRALDPGASFIVQAPAGSGKTELLTQRFLRLLAEVQHPEEIVALTFTRKAAAEMRARIYSVLHDVETGASPQSDNDRIRFSLAEDALRRDRDRNWQLLDNPQRLRLMTIDAFNGTLVRQMPLVSAMGGVLETTDQAGKHYREAARCTLEHLGDSDGHGPALEILLRYFDNRAERVEQQLVAMLDKREQWLKPIGSTFAVDESELKKQLELELGRQVELRLHNLCEATPDELAAGLIPFARAAAEQLRVGGVDSPIARLADIDKMPGGSWAALAHWSAIAELLLTNNGSVRKSVTVKQGFPAAGSAPAGDREIFAASKRAMQALLDSLAETPRFTRLLQAARSLPGHGYSEDRWQILRALSSVLLLAVAELRVEFAARGQIDHGENTLRALEALGDDEAPTDLALSLDYSIRHLLVDEFQDTSVAQFQLLEKLVRGWQIDDGRSLFLVGDPMQSIYRFRQAEVGLFQRARRHGIGDVPLTPLYLTQNFRSSANLVEWTNRTFTHAFGASESAAEGAVGYTASVASGGDVESQVKVHAFRDWSSESQRVVEIIQLCQRQHPDRNIAVLVRSRAHLLSLYPLLQRHALAYQAVGIEYLADRAVVRDLMSLTRALLHPADTIAWLAILRAPWCGLTLADLLALRERGELLSATALDQIGVECVSRDGSRRLRRFQLAMQPAMRLAGRVPWAHSVTSAWLALGGPACVEQAIDLRAAEIFFDELAAVQNESAAVSIADLQERIGERAAPLENPGDARLQLMTIHKAKGLEFDTVIVPNLGRFGRADEPLPIRWLQSDDGRLLLAPAKRPDEPDVDAIYQLIGMVEKEKADNELKRLLYVAVTRARSEVHLLGHAVEKNGATSCDKRSLLHVIWPLVEAQFANLQVDTEIEAPDPATTEAGSPPAFWRLPAEWQLPVLRDAVDPDNLPLGQYSQVDANVEFDWAGATARHTGTVVHHYLQRIAEQGLERWSAARITSAGASIGAALLELGHTKDECANSVQRCQRALINALDDPRGQWLLGQRDGAASEFALSGPIDSEVKRLVIDRTFIDENDIRWIVDYKTGEHLGADIEQFLDREQSRYRRQLQEYADLMRHIDTRPIRLGLYFPMLMGWREWAA